MMSADMSKPVIDRPSRDLTRLRGTLGRVLVHASVILFCVVWFTPVLSLVATSFRTDNASAFSGWWHILGDETLALDNYRQAFDLLGIGTSLANSIVLTIPTVIGTVLFSLSLARFRKTIGQMA